MKPAKPNLKKMIEEIEWITITPNRGKKVSRDEVAVSFCISDSKKPDVIDRVLIRIGDNIIEKLKWKQKDKIVVMHDKNNLMNFLLVKTEAGTGFSLGLDGSAGYKVQFKWQHMTPLKKRLLTPVDHHIQNNQLLVFNVEEN
jgi:hypothetical protein